VLLDSSSLGKIEVCGPDAAAFLNRMYVNNVETLKPGRIRYGMMLNENGIIIDDGVFTRLREDFFIVSTSSAGLAKVFIAFEEWLQTEWPDLQVLVCNVTSQWATLTVSGPDSRTVMERFLPGIDLSAELFPHMSVMTGEMKGMPWRLMRVSFSGELSFELNVPANHARSVWTQLIRYGQEFDITPLGMEALDFLRIEKGYLEVGVDTDVSTNPLDVGWGNAIANKAADFVGKRSLKRTHDQHPGRQQLVGLKPSERSRLLPVGSHIISRQSGQPEGHITSSCISPTLGYSIAMAMLESGRTRTGENIFVDVEGQQLEAIVSALGCYDPGNERIHR
jgi:sarcosine oxidase subunit alpha